MKLLILNVISTIFPRYSTNTIVGAMMSPQFLKQLSTYAIASSDSDDARFVKLSLLQIISNGGKRGFIKLQPYKEMLKNMGSADTPENLKQQMRGPNRDLYFYILQYLEEYLAQTGCEVGVVSMIEARDKVIRRVILTHWNEFFPEIFKTDMDLSDLWYVYNFMEDLLERDRWLCWNNRDVFQYMHKIIEQKHNVSTDDKEKCAELFFNIKSMCRQTGCISFSDDDGD